MTLNPLSPSALNAKVPSHSPNQPAHSFFDHVPSLKTTNARVEPSKIFDEDEIDWDDEPSSPFVTVVSEEHQRIASGPAIDTMPCTGTDCAELGSSPTPQQITPLRHNAPFDICEDDTASFPPPSELLRLHSPSKSSSPFKLTSPNKQLAAQGRISIKEESQTSAVSSQSSHSSSLGSSYHHEEFRSDTMHSKQSFRLDSIDPMADTTALTFVTAGDPDNVDDSCFSAFSEVHNVDMTKSSHFMGRSPTRPDQVVQLVKLVNISNVLQTPRSIYSHLNTPNTQRTVISQSESQNPTPRAGNWGTDNDTTNLLLDFTQQFEAVSTLSQRLRAASRRSMSPTKQGSNGPEPQLRSYLNSQRSPRKAATGAPSTPSSKNLLTLLDFELPPAPTPRSIPSITIREIESLKSNFASEISSLKATLSGREAEVEALKRAVSDAERRVGEAAEELREEKSKNDCIEKEKEEWERRGKEFEEVLRRVKAEVLESEKEKEAVQQRAEASDERVHELEQRLADAEARAARAESAKVDATVMANSDGKENSGDAPIYTAAQHQKKMDERIHALSTELHAIYKKKHITKVAGLKKGFESKAKEMTSELQTKIEKLERKNDELQTKLDGTLSGVLPFDMASGQQNSAEREESRKKLEEQCAVIERQRAELAGREEELKTQRSEFATLMGELEKERVEKGELVAAVDEMLALQADISVLNVSEQTSSAPSTRVEDVLRKSVNASQQARASGLARPGFGFGQSRIGAPSGLARPTAGKSKMMSNIERMGGGRGFD